MTGPTLRERLRDAGLSAWELGDLLGIHPHLLRDPHPLLTGRPVQVLIEIARRLDIHPADLVPDQARVLLGALAVGQKWQGGNYPGLRARPGWAAAEAALRETGLIYSRGGPDEVHVSDDVRFSLRYSDDDHIARELGEPPLPAHAVIPPARAGGPGRRPARSRAET